MEEPGITSHLKNHFDFSEAAQVFVQILTDLIRLVLVVMNSKEILQQTYFNLVSATTKSYLWFRLHPLQRTLLPLLLLVRTGLRKFCSRCCRMNHDPCSLCFPLPNLASAGDPQERSVLVFQVHQVSVVQMLLLIRSEI